MEGVVVEAVRSCVLCVLGFSGLIRGGVERGYIFDSNAIKSS